MKFLVSRIFLQKLTVALTLSVVTIFCKGQSVFNSNFVNFNFLNANKVHKVGTNGSAAGNVTLYTNIITIGGQQIDCIIRTVSLSGGTFTIPGGAPAGTIPFDYSSASGTGMSANEDRFFSPTFNWTAAGSCRFKFEFIMGGSYNNGTNTGTAVILQNVYVNSYDIDGNGSGSSNQNNEFSRFNTAQFKTGTGSNLTPTYNTTTGMTRFRSNATTNTTNVVDDATRLKIGYAELSSIDIIVGGDGGGAAYYFIDFGQGPSWTITPAVITTPMLDLNTNNAGLNNNTVNCGNPTKFSDGAANLTGSSNAIDELEISIPAAEVLNGNNEIFVPRMVTAAADSIRLGTPFTGTQNIILNGTTYAVSRTASSGINTLRVTPTSGTFTTVQAENFIDSLRYVNVNATPATGTRNFTFTLREGYLKSVPATYQAEVNCLLLPVTWRSFTAVKHQEGNSFLNWSTSNEINAQDYIVQHSINGNSWNNLATVAAVSNSNSVSRYRFTHLSPASGDNFYRVLQRDRDGKNSVSAVVRLSFKERIPVLQLLTNPVQGGNLKIRLNEPADVNILNANGQQIFSQKMSTGNQAINVWQYPAGIYMLRTANTSIKFIVD